MTYARVVRSYAVIREAVVAGSDSAKWPRLSPGEAKNIATTLGAAIELYEALEELLESYLDALPGSEDYGPVLAAQAALTKARGEA